MIENLAALSTAVVVSGLLTVFLALVILIAAVYAMGAILNRNKPKQDAPPAAPAAPAAAPKAAPAPQPPAQLAQQGGDQEIAVITAAVAATMAAEGNTAPFAVTSVRRVKDVRPVWGFAGMQQNTRPF